MINVGGKNVNKQVSELKADNANKQDWYEVYDKLKVANDRNLIFKKTDADNLQIYINHYGTRYQKWNFSRSNGFDNSVTSHANGNAWQIDRVYNVKLESATTKNKDHVDVTKVGTWTTSTSYIYSLTTGEYVEIPVKGRDIYLTYLSLDSNGIAEIKIDGVVAQTLDMYENNSGIGRTIQIASGLDNVTHTVRITVTGTKNASSSGYKVWFKEIKVVADIDFNDLTNITETSEALPSASTWFRYGESAIEIAIRSAYGGNTVWSGTYHKNLYPVVADGQKVYINGSEITTTALTTNKLYTAKDIRIVQDLRVLNGSTDIAKLTLMHHFTSEGCTVKWLLEWLQNVTVVSSYNAMFGTSANKIMFGDTQTSISAVKDSAEKGNYKTYNFIGWNTTDDYLVAMKALNIPKMAFTNVAKYMFFADRTTDSKVYIPRFVGDVVTGDKWISEFKIGISKCNNTTLVLAQ